MAIKNRTQLKAEFVSGTAATAAKFEDIFDSHFNKYEDSVLAGPVGETGTNGLVGPSGSTFYNGLLGPEGATYFIGLWLDTVSSGPSGSTSSGSTGQVIIADEFVYICRSENNWIRITGSTSF